MIVIPSRSANAALAVMHAQDKFVRACQTKGFTLADVRRKARALARVMRHRTRVG